MSYDEIPHITHFDLLRMVCTVMNENQSSSLNETVEGLLTMPLLRPLWLQMVTNVVKLPSWA